jgi:hypothetical protein
VKIKLVKGGKYIEEIKTGKLLTKHKVVILRAFEKHGKRVTEDLQKIITTGSRSGKVYVYRGRKIQSSAAGEPPANRSGKLGKSFDCVNNTERLSVGSKAFAKGKPYPLFLEEGTIRMRPRPFFKITCEKNDEELKTDLKGLKNV